MSIDPTTPDGAQFRALMHAMYERQEGMSGGRRWSRGNMRPARIRPPLQLLEDYRAGDPPLRSDVHGGWAPHLRQFVRMGRLNLADLIVSTTANRIQLRDFRTSAADDEFGDAQARRILRANSHELVASDVNETMLALGDAYVIVARQPGEEIPLITAESPFEVITREDPTTGRTLAALKVVRDEWDSSTFAYYYSGGLVTRFQLTGRDPMRPGGKFRFDPNAWNEGESARTPQMPVVRFRNRDGVGEFERHLDSLDRINDKIFNEWWIAKIQAFRQRAIRNLPDTREVVQEDGSIQEELLPADYYDGMFTASPDEMWQVPGDVEFWESTAVDMTPITTAIDKDVRRLAAAASVALPSMVPDAANGSAEGAALSREEHVYKVEDRMRRVGAGWSKVMACAFDWMGDADRAQLDGLEAIFGPVERFSLAQRASAAAQAVGSLPREAIQRDIWQYPPAELAELRQMAGRDLIFQTPAITQS